MRQFKVATSLERFFRFNGRLLSREDESIGTNNRCGAAPSPPSLPPTLPLPSVLPLSSLLSPVESLLMASLLERIGFRPTNGNAAVGPVRSKAHRAAASSPYVRPHLFLLTMTVLFGIQEGIHHLTYHIRLSSALAPSICLTPSAF